MNDQTVIRPPSAPTRIVLGHQPLILDTETTGLGADAEIVEIGIVNEWGGIVFESLIKSKAAIPEAATAIHGISNADVADAPTWADVHDRVANIIRARTVAIYNAAYDVRLVQQTAGLYHRLVPEYTPWCAMLEYAKWWAEWDDARASWKWQRLMTAAAQMDIGFPDRGRAHRAVYDCLLTLGVMRAMADLPREDQEIKTYGSEGATEQMFEELKYLPRAGEDD